jgi:hypothetical protein
MIRVRFGWKIPVFKNLAIVVLRLTESQFAHADSAVSMLRSALGVKADSLIWEVSHGS